MTDKTEKASCPNGAENCPIFSDIEALRDKVTQLSDQVRTDFLTDLYNKRHLLFSLEQEIERTTRNHQATSLILLDIDHFKSVNDTHGHVVGDKVLTQIAKIIKQTIRKIDIPCRYGGEEFAIVLPSSPILTGVQVAERLRKTVEGTLFQISSTLTLNITISVGVDSVTHANAIGPQALIEHADAQLYKAKEAGRNCVRHRIAKREETALVSRDEKDALFEALDTKPKSKNKK